MNRRTFISAADKDTSIAGIDAKTLLARLSKEREPLIAVAKHLSHPHINDYRDDPFAELEHQVVLAAEHYAATRRGVRKPHVADVLLYAIFHAEMAEKTRREILGGVEVEADLTEPITKYLKDKHALRVEREVTIGSRRADLVGFKKSWGARRMVAVELKNNHLACEWLEPQINAYVRATDESWVVVTPHCMIGLAHHKGTLCDPGQVAARIEKLGASLYIYDSTTGEFTRVHEGSSEYHKPKYDELWARYHPTPAPTATAPCS